LVKQEPRPHVSVKEAAKEFWPDEEIREAEEKEWWEELPHKYGLF
jgi:hypothetical protein